MKIVCNVVLKVLITYLRCQWKVDLNFIQYVQNLVQNYFKDKKSINCIKNRMIMCKSMDENLSSSSYLI